MLSENSHDPSFLREYAKSNADTYELLLLKSGLIIKQFYNKAALVSILLKVQGTPGMIRQS